MFWHVSLQIDRPSLRRNQDFLSLRFRSEAGYEFTSNSVPIEQVEALWQKISVTLSRHYRDRLSVVKAHLAHDLEDLFNVFFPNPAAFGRGFTQLFEENNHRILFIIANPNLLWFPLELFYCNQNFLGMRHCVVRQSVALHELQNHGLRPPLATLPYWVERGAGEAANESWANPDLLNASAKRIETLMHNAIHTRAESLEDAAHFYFIGHGKPIEIDQGGLAFENDSEADEWFTGKTDSEKTFQPALIFANACHSAHTGTEKSFPRFIAENAIPLFIGHSNLIVPEIAEEVANQFFEKFYHRNETLSSAWIHARGADTGIPLKDGSASLLGYQVYAYHPDAKLLKDESEIAAHLKSLKKESDFRTKPESPLARAIKISAVLLICLFLFYVLFSPDTGTKDSDTGAPIVEGQTIIYTRPWIISKENTSLIPKIHQLMVRDVVFEKDVMIEPGASLTIQSGTNIYFNKDIRMFVHGDIQALGEKDKPIVFTARKQDDENRWGGILISPEMTQRGENGSATFSGEPSSRFYFCEFSWGGGFPIKDYYNPKPAKKENWYLNDQIVYEPFGTENIEARERDRRGGAIFIWRADSEFHNCTFANNTASRGGALYLRNDFTGSFMKDCKFINNKATSVGGSIFIIGSILEGENLIFRNCSAEFGGGGICVFQDSKLILGKSRFIENHAGKAGGGIFIYHDIDIQTVLRYTHNLNQLRFVNNTSGRDGAGLSYDGDCGNVEARNIRFIGNRIVGQDAEFEQDKEGCALFLRPRTRRDSAEDNPLEFHLESFSFLYNVIEWHPHYEQSGSEVKAYGNAAFFEYFTNSILTLINWSAKGNVSYSSDEPFRYSAGINNQAKDEVKRTRDWTSIEMVQPRKMDSETAVEYIKQHQSQNNKPE